MVLQRTTTAGAKSTFGIVLRCQQIVDLLIINFEVAHPKEVFARRVGILYETENVLDGKSDYARLIGLG